MNIMQGSMLVAQYKQKFNELLEFAPSIVATDVDRCKKFQDGLHVNIRDKLTTLDTDEFNKQANMVVKAKQNLKEMKNKENKFKKERGNPPMRT